MIQLLADWLQSAHTTSFIFIVIPTLIIAFVWIQIYTQKVSWKFIIERRLQIHVIRIMLMVPLYSICSFLGLRFPSISVLFRTLREIYEAIALYSFYSMLSLALGGDRSLSLITARLPPQQHPWPLDSCFPPFQRGGKFVWHTKVGTLQFVLIKPLLVLVSLVCEIFGVLGEGSMSFKTAYVYIAFLTSMSQMYAIYCMALLYICVREEIAPIRPLFKFFSIKTIIFFTYWQGLTITILLEMGVITNNSDHDAAIIAIQMQEFLICFEMLFFALYNIYAFQASDFQNIVQQQNDRLARIKDEKNTQLNRLQSTRPLNHQRYIDGVGGCHNGPKFGINYYNPTKKLQNHLNNNNNNHNTSLNPTLHGTTNQYDPTNSLFNQYYNNSSLQDHDHTIIHVGSDTSSDELLRLQNNSSILPLNRSTAFNSNLYNTIQYDHHGRTIGRNGNVAAEPDGNYLGNNIHKNKNYNHFHKNNNNNIDINNNNNVTRIGEGPKIPNNPSTSASITNTILSTFPQFYSFGRSAEANDQNMGDEQGIGANSSTNDADKNPRQSRSHSRRRAPRKPLPNIASQVILQQYQHQSQRNNNNSNNNNDISGSGVNNNNDNNTNGTNNEISSDLPLSPYSTNSLQTLSMLNNGNNDHTLTSSSHHDSINNRHNIVNMINNNKKQGRNGRKYPDFSDSINNTNNNDRANSFNPNDPYSVAFKPIKLSKSIIITPKEAVGAAFCSFEPDSNDRSHRPEAMYRPQVPGSGNNNGNNKNIYCNNNDNNNNGHHHHTVQNYTNGHNNDITTVLTSSSAPLTYNSKSQRNRQRKQQQQQQQQSSQSHLQDDEHELIGSLMNERNISSSHPHQSGKKRAAIASAMTSLYDKITGTQRAAIPQDELKKQEKGLLSPDNDDDTQSDVAGTSGNTAINGTSFHHGVSDKASFHGSNHGYNNNHDYQSNRDEDNRMYNGTFKLDGNHDGYLGSFIDTAGAILRPDDDDYGEDGFKYNNQGPMVVVRSKQTFNPSSQQYNNINKNVNNNNTKGYQYNPTNNKNGLIKKLQNTSQNSSNTNSKNNDSFDNDPFSFDQLDVGEGLSPHGLPTSATMIDSPQNQTTSHNSHQFLDVTVSPTLPVSKSNTNDQFIPSKGVNHHTNRPNGDFNQLYNPFDNNNFFSKNQNNNTNLNTSSENVSHSKNINNNNNNNNNNIISPNNNNNTITPNNNNNTSNNRSHLTNHIPMLTSPLSINTFDRTLEELGAQHDALDLDAIIEDILLEKAKQKQNNRAEFHGVATPKLRHQKATRGADILPLMIRGANLNGNGMQANGNGNENGTVGDEKKDFNGIDEKNIHDNQFDYSNSLLQTGDGINDDNNDGDAHRVRSDGNNGLVNGSSIILMQKGQNDHNTVHKQSNNDEEDEVQDGNGTTSSLLGIINPLFYLTAAIDMTDIAFDTRSTLMLNRDGKQEQMAKLLKQTKLGAGTPFPRDILDKHRDYLANMKKQQQEISQQQQQQTLLHLDQVMKNSSGNKDSSLVTAVNSDNGFNQADDLNTTNDGGNNDNDNDSKEVDVKSILNNLTLHHMSLRLQNAEGNTNRNNNGVDTNDDDGETNDDDERHYFNTMDTSFSLSMSTDNNNNTANQSNSVSSTSNIPSNNTTVPTITITSTSNVPNGACGVANKDINDYKKTQDELFELDQIITTPKIQPLTTSSPQIQPIMITSLPKIQPIGGSTIESVINPLTNNSTPTTQSTPLARPESITLGDLVPLNDIPLNLSLNNDNAVIVPIEDNVETIIISPSSIQTTSSHPELQNNLDNDFIFEGISGFEDDMDQFDGVDDALDVLSQPQSQPLSHQSPKQPSQPPQQLPSQHPPSLQEPTHSNNQTASSILQLGDDIDIDLDNFDLGVDQDDFQFSFIDDDI